MMKMKNIKAIFRRGQAQASSKSEQGQLQGQIREDLSRSSSVTNLNSDHKNKGAFSKLRKSASKDRLDKLADNKKNDKKGLSRNNNKLDSGEGDLSLESVQEIEMLHRQLNDMAKEKSELALELGERKGELQTLNNEIAKLKMFKEQSTLRIEQLNDENTSLRNRLRDVSHSPLSDNEKQQLLLDTHRHSSAPASIATNLLEDGSMGDITACTTPEWDKHSSSNVSEVSVACLQDKINQMQETHYSTNEELQATLQELTDLQRQLTELQQDNERLLDEKNLMFDSLCRQTERLNDARAEVESLKQLLYRDKDETGQLESIVDREQKLVDLLKSAQEERETLLVKQEQLNNELQDIRTLNVDQINEIEQLTERVRTLESTLDAKHAEHRQLDQELAIAKDQCSGRQIEINRLSDLLENARTKINELEQERALNDKSELDELLDNARKEKDALESEVANLKEQVARSRNETEKLKEQVSILQEECKVTRNNAKCTQSELEYKCEKLTVDKNSLTEQLQQLQEAANELQVQAQCQLEDKRQLSAVLSETQRNLSEAERKNSELDDELEDLKRLRKEENEEWEKFQNDLLTSVRVANDFKSEAQQELQKMIMENKSHRERIRQLETQIDKLKGKSKGEELQTPPFVAPFKQHNTTLIVHRPNTLKINDPTASDNFVSEISIDIEPTSPKKKTTFFSIFPCKAHKNNSEIKQQPQETDTERYSEFSKIVNNEPEQFEKPIVKKRKDPKNFGKYLEKRLSDQEERDLAMLNDLYSQIDPKTPTEQLTTDEKYIVKLKEVFDNENGPKIKPVSKKPKDKLAISKPLLDSVLNNPKLKEITEDRNVIQIEHDFTLDNESDPFSSYDMTCEPETSFDDIYRSSHSEYNFENFVRPKSVSSFKPELLKSKSLDNVYYKSLASNAFQNNESNKTSENYNITYENLDLLYNVIDKNRPFDELTNKDKFVVKLRDSLEQSSSKNDLDIKETKKRPTKLFHKRSNSFENIASYRYCYNKNIYLKIPRARLSNESKKRMFIKRSQAEKSSNRPSDEVSEGNQFSTTEQSDIKPCNDHKDDSLPKHNKLTEDTQHFEFSNELLQSKDLNNKNAYIKELKENLSNDEKSVVLLNTKIEKQITNKLNLTFNVNEEDTLAMKENEVSHTKEPKLNSEQSDIKLITSILENRNANLLKDDLTEIGAKALSDSSVVKVPSAKETNESILCLTQNQPQKHFSNTIKENQTEYYSLNPNMISRTGFSEINSTSSKPIAQFHQDNAKDNVEEMSQSKRPHLLTKEQHINVVETTSIKKIDACTTQKNITPIGYQNSITISHPLKDTIELPHPQLILIKLDEPASTSIFKRDDLTLDPSQNDSLESILDEHELKLVEKIKSDSKRSNSDINEEDLKIIAMAKQHREVDDVIECFNNEIEFKRNDDSKIINRTSFTDKSVQEPIYANYSVFLNQMINQTAEETSDSKPNIFVSKKQPLPLPRSASLEIINLESENSSDANSSPKSQNVITKTNRAEEIRREHVSSKTEQDMTPEDGPMPNLISERTEIGDKFNVKKVKIFGNVEKFFETHTKSNELFFNDGEEDSKPQSVKICNVECVTEGIINNGESLKERKIESDTQTPKDDNGRDTDTQTNEESFSLLNVFEKLGHIISDTLTSGLESSTMSHGNVSSSENVLTDKNANLTDDLTQTDPIVIEHYMKPEMSKNSSVSNQDSNILDDALEQIVASHILNNPPVQHRHYHRTRRSSAENKTHFENTKKKFENMIQTNQFKSETIKLALGVKKSSVNSSEFEIRSDNKSGSSFQLDQ